MTHTTHTHHSQPNGLTELWFFGPAIKNIIIRGRSISLKQISIPLYCKSLLSFTHTWTETCYSPAVQQNYFCVEAGTLQLRITICWGTEGSPWYLERKDIHSSLCSQKGTSLQGPPHRWKLRVFLANLSLFCFSLLPTMMTPESLITKADVYSHMGGFPVYSGYCITLH